MAFAGSGEHQTPMNSATELMQLDPYDAVKRPVTGSGDDRLRHLLAWALLSPSPHNTQPWSWSVADGVVELRGDFSRHLTVSDPDGRELAIGCGSALEHLLLRLGVDGDPLGIDMLPDGAESTLYARITVGAGEPYVARRDLVDAMAVRRTNRTAYHGDPMDHTLRSSLDAACAAFGVSCSSWSTV
jgi:nitroreductase